MSHGTCKQSVHASKNLQFFKIILEETLKNKSLLIPKKFARIYGETLSDNVHVKLPCGSHWEMGLTKRDGGLWLTRGWPEFAKHYSIGLGHLLLFRYLGSSKFHVEIFDTTTVEVDHYPKIELDEHDVVDIDDSVEIVEDINPRKRAKTSPDFEIKGKKKKAELESDAKNPLDASALDRANGFSSKRPYFTVVMCSTNVLSGRMNIPMPFMMRYPKSIRGNVILKARGNTNMYWSAKYSSKIYNRNVASRLGKGWIKFVRENNLRVGDVCVFVLLEGKPVTFNIEIFRVDVVTKTHEPLDIKREKSEPKSESDPEGNLGLETCGTSLESKGCIGDLEKARILERAHFVSKNPFFKLVMQPSYVRTSHLNVPSDFVKRYIKKEREIILRDENSRRWSVQFKVLKKGSQLCRGWSKFVKDNNLEVGDVCIFEIIKGAKFSFKVSIARIRSNKG